MVRRLPLNGLRAFEASARSGSFTLAAKELHVTQAAVSQQVRLLEERLGFALFRRHANGLELTDQARAFQPGLRTRSTRSSGSPIKWQPCAPVLCLLSGSRRLS